MDIRKCEVVLASGSPRRREILENAHIKFTVVPAQGEEKVTSTVPEEVVRKLSFDKATEVSCSCEQESLVIGADTVVAIDGQILGKPTDERDAARMLRELSGRTHSVFTGVTVIYKGMFGDTISQFAAETKVHVYPLTEDEIWDYVNSGEPMDKAGAYAIQGGFAEHVSGIEGEYLNVVGLPLAQMLHEIKNMEAL